MHEQHAIFESDDNFDTGTLAHLTTGNEGRAMDGRRTPGFIESYDENSAMFVWRITAFEDNGRCWEIPAEQINCYQFRKGSHLLSQEQIKKIEDRCKTLNQTLIILKSATAYAETENSITQQEKIAQEWIINNSAFYKSGMPLIFDANEGFSLLFADLENFLSEYDLYELEKLIAEQYLLNPYSGELIKCIKIVMAEMGLISYSGTAPRKPDAFTGIADKDNLRRYIISRLAFVRSMFKLKGIVEVPLFRGMSGEGDFFETPHSLLSATFSSDTAMSFADISQTTNARSAYLVKFTFPVEKLFMTFFETKEFNERYKEQEAVIFYEGQIKF